MKINILQKGFNYSQDGPGNRLVYHLQGCNLHCPWCSNPESMPFFEAGVKVDEVIDEIVRSKPMFFDNGGVTFTGGEATMQFDALQYILSNIHAFGINTAIETNGTNKKLNELFGDIDFLIMDFKHYNSQKHNEYTGIGNETILMNLHSAAEKRSQLLIRIPLINNINAEEKDAHEFAKFIKRLPKQQYISVEVLKYHEYGKDKWKKCKKEYTMHDAFVSQNKYESFCKVLTESGISLINT